jgi:hypothetical protein
LLDGAHLVLLTRLVDHPIDSRARPFEQAAVRAMSHAFEAAGVPAPPI